MFQSETYELEDCYFVETGSSTTNYASTGGTLAITDGVISLTKGSGTTYFYLNVPKTNLPIADFKNKQLTVRTEIVPSGRVTSTLFYHNGVSWSNGVIVQKSDEGTIENTIYVPSEATQVRIRFDIGGSENDVATFTNLRLILL